MKSLEDKVMFALYGAFGAFVGFVVYLAALGGWSFVFIGEATEPWNGPVALIICLVIGGGWALVAYKFSDREFGAGGSSLFEDQPTAILFSKRLMVIATCLASEECVKPIGLNRERNDRQRPS